MADLLALFRAALADRYAVERELGRGGMATVYLAQDLKHQRPVAVKLLDPELGRAVGAERFLREIEIVAKLQHPHILPLYDSGAAEGFLYYVMPYVEGETLRDRLEREKQLSLEETIKIATEVASALSYAHSRGVVHRDIKPENIMLSGGSAVVADFGIARAVSAAEGKSLTQTGTVIGTPAYMSPEQAAGSGEIDGRSDQYSLACVVYEMLVGEPPFTGPTPQAVMARHSIGAVSLPSIVRPTVSEAVEDAILRGLAKVPADRFATTLAFAEALTAPAGAATTATRRRTTRAGLQAERAPRRWRWAVAAVAPLAVLALAWVTRSLWLGSTRAAVGGLDAHHIAVRYFEDLSPGKTLGYLADGLTEGLIDQLSEVSGLEVVSNHGVAPFPGVDVSRDSIARALQVGSLIEGAVEPAGDRLRVTVRLVDGPSGADIDRKSYELPAGRAATVRDSITQEVARLLRTRLGEEIRLHERRAETADIDAWVLLQRAARLRKDAKASLEAADTAAAARQLAGADSLLERASSLDGKWVRPVVDRGWITYQALDLVGTFDKQYYGRWITKGLEHAERALTLKPNDGDALEVRGTLRYYRWILNLAPNAQAAATLLADAERDLRGSVEANPQQASAWALLSHLLMRRSQTAEGKLAALRAYEADPYLAEAPRVLWRLYASSLDLEDAVEAGRWCEEGHRRFPTEPNFVECQITLHALPGQRPDVVRMWRLLDENVALYPPNQREFRRRRGEMLVAMTLVRAGLADSARRVAERARADATVDPARELVYIEAMLRNLLGDREEALRLLSEYLATNPQDRASMAKDYTWWWRGLRDDPRFKTLVGITS